MKFVYKRIIYEIVTELCSFVAIFAFILSIDYRQYRHTFYSILKFFFNKFPENNIFYLLCFCSLWASGTKLHFPCMSKTQNTKNWLHFIQLVAFLLLLTVSLSKRSYTSLFQHVKLCVTIHRRRAILPQTQICKFRRTKFDTVAPRGPDLFKWCFLLDAVREKYSYVSYATLHFICRIVEFNRNYMKRTKFVCDLSA